MQPVIGMTRPPCPADRANRQSRISRVGPETPPIDTPAPSPSSTRRLYTTGIGRRLPTKPPSSRQRSRYVVRPPVRSTAGYAGGRAQGRRPPCATPARLAATAALPHPSVMPKVCSCRSFRYDSHVVDRPPWGTTDGRRGMWRRLVPGRSGNGIEQSVPRTTTSRGAFSPCRRKAARLSRQR